MELENMDMMLLYLYEVDSFNKIQDNPVSASMTKDAISLKCGLSRKILEDIISNNGQYFTIRDKKIKGKKVRSDCVFLVSKGVKIAKGIQSKIQENKVDLFDENGDRHLTTLGDVKKVLDRFSIHITFLDLYLRSKRDENINVKEFIEPEGWRDDLFKDHAFPDKIILSSTSCIPFGGIFTIFGEPGLVVPVNKHIEIGIHPFGEGNLIRWMKRYDGELEDAYYIKGKKGFQSLVSGHSDMMDRYDLYKDKGIFESEEEYRSYFDTLKKFDYSIIFSSGTSHGISMSGHIGTILAAIALTNKQGIGFPINGMKEIPANPRLRNNEKIPVWDFELPFQPTTISEIIRERHEGTNDVQKVERLFLKFSTLAQIFERHWNYSFSASEANEISDFQDKFDLKEFSSGGACITSSFASPATLRLEKDGSVSLDSVLYPEMALNQNIGLLIDRKGGIDNPRDEFNDTFHRFYPLIKAFGTSAFKHFKTIKACSGSLAELSSKVLLESQSFADPESIDERKAVSALITMQKGIYASLGIRNPSFDEVESSIRSDDVDIGITPVGVGNSGTYFFCLPDPQTMISLRNSLEMINSDRIKNQRVELVTQGSSHMYIFNVDPLMVLNKK